MRANSWRRRDGFPVAVLMSYQEYQRLCGEKAVAAFEDFSRLFGREIEHQGATEQEVLTELEAIKQQVYDEKYGRRT